MLVALCVDGIGLDLVPVHISFRYSLRSQNLKKCRQGTDILTFVRHDDDPITARESSREGAWHVVHSRQTLAAC